MDQKTLYTRALSADFLYWLNENKLLKTIKSNPLLNIGMRGNKINIYYRGAKILTITDRIISNPKKQLIQLDSKYIGTESICPPTLDNIQEYLNEAICAVNNSGKVVAEQEIRQTIAYANNLSANANDTDYFIVDQEYSAPSSSGKNCKFDMVALRWPSKKKARRSPNIKDFEIVIFELKHGINAVGSSSKAQNGKAADLKSHMEDFKSFVSNDSICHQFKHDILSMFRQQCILEDGFFCSGKMHKYEKIKGLKHIPAFIESLTDSQIERIPVKFGFIISDYKLASTVLTEQLSMFDDDFLFATSSFMGYGLYDAFIINRNQLNNILSK